MAAQALAANGKQKYRELLLGIYMLSQVPTRSESLHYRQKYVTPFKRLVYGICAYMLLRKGSSREGRGVAQSKGGWIDHSVNYTYLASMGHADSL